MCSLAITTFVFVNEMSVQVFANVKSWALCPFLLICMISLIYSEYKSFFRYRHCTYSSQSVQTVFHSKNLINVFRIKLEEIEVTLGRGRWSLIHLVKPWLWPKTYICCHTHSAVLTSIHRWLILFISSAISPALSQWAQCIPKLFEKRNIYLTKICNTMRDLKRGLEGYSELTGSGDCFKA